MTEERISMIRSADDPEEESGNRTQRLVVLLTIEEEEDLIATAALYGERKGPYAREILLDHIYGHRRKLPRLRRK